MVVPQRDPPSEIDIVKSHPIIEHESTSVFFEHVLQYCDLHLSEKNPPLLCFPIFSIAMGADYSIYVKIIETHARAFFKVIICSMGTVIPFESLPRHYLNDLTNN